MIRVDAVTVQSLHNLIGGSNKRRDFSDFIRRYRRIIRGIADVNILSAVAQQIAVQLFIGVDIRFIFLARHFIQRRLGNVNVAGLDQRFEFAEEERQQQCADVRTVHISICHDDDAVVTQTADIEILFSEAAADGGDQRLDLLVFQDFVNARLFHVDEFASNRNDRLEGTVAPLFGGTACGITLDDVKFTDGRIF